MPFDQRDLAIFLSVYRLGSIGRAAVALSLSQPAVSRALGRLENRLGAKLFVRHATGMEPTSFGQAILPHAESIEAEIRRTVEEIDVLKGSAKGLVRIGIIPSVASNLLSRAVSRLLERSPAIHVRVVEDTGNRLVAALLRGDIELAVVGLWRDPIDEDVSVTPLFEDEICVLGRWSHPAWSENNLSLNTLRNYRWTMPEKGNVIWGEFRLMFRSASLEPPVVTVEANSAHTLKSLVATTDLLTVLARETFQIEERAGLLRPLPLAQGCWRRHVGVLRRSTGRLLPVANLLYSEILRIASAL